uniref:Uncharacterized protein n=1 Tax=Acrobeloides nanus TaxID=290746 RepID=A0A914CYA5_9BILA
MASFLRYSTKFKPKDPTWVENSQSKTDLRNTVTEAYAEINTLNAYINSVYTKIPILNGIDNKFAELNTNNQDLISKQLILEEKIVSLHKEVSSLEQGTFFEGLNQKVADLAEKLTIIENFVTTIDSKIGLIPEINTKVELIAKSYADAVKKPVSEGLAQITRSVIREEAMRSERDSCVFIRDAEPNAKIDDIIHDISNVTGIPINELQGFHLGKKPQKTSLRIKTSSKEMALKLLKEMPTIRTKSIYLKNASARPDYSPTELETYRKSWQEAIQKNNLAGKKEFSVRNLQVIKLKEPQAWICKKTDDNVTTRKTSTIRK